MVFLRGKRKLLARRSCSKRRWSGMTIRRRVIALQKIRSLRLAGPGAGPARAETILDRSTNSPAGHRRFGHCHNATLLAPFKWGACRYRQIPDPVTTLVVRPKLCQVAIRYSGPADQRDRLEDRSFHDGTL